VQCAQLYSPDLVTAFVNVVRELLLASPNAVAFVATTIRKPETFALFEREVQDRGLLLVDETHRKHDTPLVFPHYCRDSIVLSRISLRDNDKVQSAS